MIEGNCFGRSLSTITFLHIYKIYHAIFLLSSVLKFDDVNFYKIIMKNS